MSVVAVLPDEKDGHGGEKQYVQHFRNFEQNENRSFSRFVRSTFESTREDRLEYMYVASENIGLKS